MTAEIVDPVTATEHLGFNIVKIAKNFRAECMENGLKYKKEEFLLGIIFGMKVYVAIEYKDGH